MPYLAQPALLGWQWQLWVAGPETLQRSSCWRQGLRSEGWSRLGWSSSSNLEVPSAFYRKQGAWQGGCCLMKDERKIWATLSRHQIMRWSQKEAQYVPFFFQFRLWSRNWKVSISGQQHGGSDTTGSGILISLNWKNIYMEGRIETKVIVE